MTNADSQMQTTNSVPLDALWNAVHEHTCVCGEYQFACFISGVESIASEVEHFCVLFPFSLSRLQQKCMSVLERCNVHEDYND